MGGPSNSIRIRQGTSADRVPAEEVWQLSVTARDGTPPTAEVTDAVHQILAAPDTALVVAEERGHLVAMACTMPGRDETGRQVPGLCHVQMIFVLPDHAGAGIGGALLDFVLNGARAAAMRRIQLWVRDDNERARRLYTGRGFAHSGRTVEENGALIGLWSRPLD